VLPGVLRSVNSEIKIMWQEAVAYEFELRCWDWGQLWVPSVETALFVAEIWTQESAERKERMSHVTAAVNNVIWSDWENPPKFVSVSESRYEPRNLLKEFLDRIGIWYLRILGIGLRGDVELFL